MEWDDGNNYIAFGVALVIGFMLTVILCLAWYFPFQAINRQERLVHPAESRRVECDEWSCRPQACGSRRTVEGGGENFDEYHKAPYKLVSFIRNQVIRELNWQRNDLSKDQFAAVVLSDRGLFDINELRLRVKNNGQLVNSGQSSYPDNSNLVNYIVACPDNMGNHAELILLDRFNELWQNFVRSARQPSLILFFSWLMPCEGCTDAFITRLGYLCGQCQVIIVFKANCRYPSDSLERNEVNRKKLSQKKFKVYRVSYTDDLPRPYSPRI